MRKGLLILLSSTLLITTVNAGHRPLTDAEKLAIYGLVHDQGHDNKQTRSGGNANQIIKKNKARGKTRGKIKCSTRRIDYTTVSDAFFNRDHITKQIIERADHYGVPADFALAIAFQETRFTQTARSTACAKGVFQLMDGTAAELGVNPNNLSQNIDGGVKYLRNLLKRYKGNQTLAAAAYNAGMGNVRKYGGVPPFKETRNYISNIQNKWQGKFKHLLAGNPDFRNYNNNAIKNISKVEANIQSQQESRSDVSEYYKQLEGYIGNQTTIYDTWNQNNVVQNANLETINQLIIAANTLSIAFNWKNTGRAVSKSETIKFTFEPTSEFDLFKPESVNEYIDDENDTCDILSDNNIDSDCVKEDTAPVIETIISFLEDEKNKYPERFDDIELPEITSTITLADATSIFKQYETKYKEE